MGGGTYTCMDYRAEMTLVGLKKRLGDKALTKKEKNAIQSEIKKLEKAIGLD